MPLTMKKKIAVDRAENLTNENCVNLIGEIISKKYLEIKLKEMQKISYQNNWNNINKKIIKVINEID